MFIYDAALSQSFESFQSAAGPVELVHAGQGSPATPVSTGGLVNDKLAFSLGRGVGMSIVAAAVMSQFARMFR